MAVCAERLDFISLCTGGGGLDLGVELAIPDARPVVLVEREAFAVAHLVAAMEAGLMAPAPVWSDARTFDGRPWRGIVDGFIGGIPCQPHSLAGRKGGQLDERDLWSAARRIIGQARPWFVLIENVAGMLSAGADDVAGAERVWRDLQRMGFAVEGGLVTAAEVGAPHERERIFVLGVADASGSRSQGRERAGASAERVWAPSSRPTAELRGALLADCVCDGCEWCKESDLGKIRSGQQAPQRCDAERCDPPLFPPGPRDIEGWRHVLAAAPHLEPAVCGLADGMASTRVDWLRLLGNGVHPLAAANAVRTLVHRLADRGAPGAERLVRMTVQP